MNRYSRGARLFHWLVVVLLAVQIPSGIAIIAEGLAKETIDSLFILHKGLGAILLIVIVLRILWRLFNPPPPMPASIPVEEQRIAAAAHATIYFVLFLMAASGYVRVVGGGFPIELLDRFGIPPLIPKMEGVAKMASLVHRFSAFALVALFSVHIAEVLRHHFVLRDKTLTRMWPL